MQNIQNDSRFYRSMSFKEFVDVICKIKIENMDIHFRPQYTFIPVKLDLLGKFESLPEDFKYLKELIGIDCELLHENKTDKTDYSIYTTDIINKVVKIYKKDFKLFGYEKSINL